MNKTSDKQKKEYEAPQVIEYGDLRELTKGSHGPTKDSGGRPGSRP